MPDAPLYVARDAEPRLTNVHEISQLLDEAYPPRLREERVSGSVALYVLVDKTGRPLRVEVQTPSVHVPFNKAATSVASEMRFEPALNDGEPVGVWILQRLDFNTR